MAPGAWIRLGTHGRTAQEAVENHMAVYRKWADRQWRRRRTFCASLHLEPTPAGWWAHHHVVIFGAAPGDILADWERAGGRRRRCDVDWAYEQLAVARILERRH